MACCRTLVDWPMTKTRSVKTSEAQAPITSGVSSRTRAGPLTRRRTSPARLQAREQPNQQLIDSQPVRRAVPVPCPIERRSTGNHGHHEVGRAVKGGSVCPGQRV